MTTHRANVDPAEIDKFAALASRWWDRNSEFKPLHDINPVRLDYITQRVDLAGKKALDVGCGGGILSESLAALGADVMGIDMGEAALSVAQLHLLESGLKVDYRHVSVEQLAEEMPGQFDVVTCMEMLEHVPDPLSVIAACAKLVKPDGKVFFTTLNRTPKSWLMAIVGAEYVLRLLPKGTHDFAKFIRPSELESWVRHGGLQPVDFSGMSYHPFTRTYSLSRDLSVNYLACCVPA
jgi:2-polyprenyl-6-hydroxyphenyl methylase/3-demethylubiquinone-9 3-methyltransferase